MNVKEQIKQLLEQCQTFLIIQNQLLRQANYKVARENATKVEQNIRNKSTDSTPTTSKPFSSSELWPLPLASFQRNCW